MNRTSILGISALSLALAACQSHSEVPAGNQPTDAPPAVLLGGGNLKLADGNEAGAVELSGSGDNVTVTVALDNIPQGTHAVHLHTTGSCEAPDFKSAGGHLNPGMKEHGTQNPKGSHLGDLPNVVVGADGKGTTKVTLPGMRADVLSEIFDKDGTAVVVHEGEDDNVSDPAGNAGSRIACGVISPA